MNEGLFFEVEFFALILVSRILPVAIYALLMLKASISRRTVLVFGVILIVLAGVDIFLLQGLATMAKEAISLIDDKIFASKLSAAIYLLPALFAGIGVNMVSHVLITHLLDVEKRFDRAHRRAPSSRSAASASSAAHPQET